MKDTKSCFDGSHPSRVRGLKYGQEWRDYHGKESHPSRVRGLKYGVDIEFDVHKHVAPFAGAWIEIGYSQPEQAITRSHPSRVRGLKFGNLSAYISCPAVAPFAGAWIEMLSDVNIILIHTVAPFAGAWIEINKMLQVV